MPDLGDGIDYSTTNWSRRDFGGNGLWPRAEGIYSLANIVDLLTNCQAAKNARTKA